MKTKETEMIKEFYLSSLAVQTDSLDAAEMDVAPVHLLVGVVDGQSVWPVQTLADKDFNVSAVHPGALDGGRRVDVEDGDLDDRFPLGPVHEPAFRIDDDGTRMRDADEQTPFSQSGPFLVAVETGDANGAPPFVRPVNVATHPIDGQALARVQSLLQ